MTNAASTRIGPKSARRSLFLNKYAQHVWRFINAALIANLIVRNANAEIVVFGYPAATVLDLALGMIGDDDERLTDGKIGIAKKAALYRHPSAEWYQA